MKRILVLDIEPTKKLNIVERGQLALIRSYLPAYFVIKEEGDG